MAVASAPWQHRFIETNTIRLHCVTQGQGDLVILLHGCLEFWYSWRYQIPALARYFTVAVPDLRGYNDSDKPLSGYDLDTLSADIQGLIQGLGYQRAHLVGHDLGGAIAWHFAQRFPDALDRLAILNAPHPHRFVQEVGTNLDHLWRSWYFLAAQVPGLPEWAIRQNLGQFVTNLFRGQAIRKGAFTTEHGQIYRAALDKPGVLAAAFNCYRQMLSPTMLWQWASRLPQPIGAPTLILWGENDTFLSKNLNQGLDRLIQAPFQLKLIPQCGHWIQQEVPQTVNRELLKFFRQPQGSGPVALVGPVGGLEP